MKLCCVYGKWRCLVSETSKLDIYLFCIPIIKQYLISPYISLNDQKRTKKEGDRNDAEKDARDWMRSKRELWSVGMRRFMVTLQVHVGASYHVLIGDVRRGVLLARGLLRI